MDEKELHRLVLSKCHRCPVNDTEEELRNPSGVYAEEYSRIWNEILKSEKPSLLKRIKNIFNN